MEEREGADEKATEPTTEQDDKTNCDKEKTEASPSGSESSEDGESSDGSDDEDGSSSDDEESGEESSEDVVGTYPYNKDSDEEEEKSDLEESCHQWLKSLNVPRPETEIITIDSDDDEIQGEMRCMRCPQGQSVYKDKPLFILHRERHKGRNHFVCPTCLKPFIKISFCFAHEVRAHDMDFNLMNLLISEAVEYRNKKRKEKELEEKEMQQSVQSEPSGAVSNSSGSPNKAKKVPELTASIPEPVPEVPEVISNEYCSNFSGLILFPEEGELETDEDDPKFYPDHAVPSTALYPYRGLEPWSVYDCYEIHLKYGRKKRTAANTISRCVLAHRQKLLEEGRIAAEDVGRFWKPKPIQRPPPPKQSTAKRRRNKKGPEQSDFASVNSNANTRKKRSARASSYCSSDDDDNNSASTSTALPPRRKKRKVVDPRKRPIVNLDLSNRDFVAGVIQRSCMLCSFVWKTQEELQAHRLEAHPNKTLIELMTVVKKPTNSDEDASSCPPKRKKRKVKDFAAPETNQELFLHTLGLINVQKLPFIKKPVPIRGKVCYVKLTKITKKISRKGRVYVCQKCDYWSNTRDHVNIHHRKVHEKKDINKIVAEKSLAASSAMISSACSSSSILTKKVNKPIPPSSLIISHPSKPPTIASLATKLNGTSVHSVHTPTKEADKLVSQLLKACFQPSLVNANVRPLTLPSTSSSTIASSSNSKKPKKNDKDGKQTKKSIPNGSTNNILSNKGPSAQSTRINIQTQNLPNKNQVNRAVTTNVQKNPKPNQKEANGSLSSESSKNPNKNNTQQLQD